MSKKTKEIVLHILKERGGATITEIVKICYLIDLVMKKKTGDQITSLKYYRYSFGPFDKRVYAVLEEMIREGSIEQEIKFKPGGEIVFYTVKNEKDPVEFEELKKDELDIVDGLLETLSGYGPKALTEITYNTAPMKALNATLGGREGWKEELNLAK